MVVYHLVQSSATERWPYKAETPPKSASIKKMF